MDFQFFKKIERNPALTWEALQPHLANSMNNLLVGKDIAKIAAEIAQHNNRGDFHPMDVMKVGPIQVYALPFLTGDAWVIGDKYSMGTNAK